ncbi:MAG: rhamnulokinase family protein [Akkermansiaceae bacterium]
MLDSETPEKVHIAIDLGASSGRVIASSLVDGKLSLSEMHRFDNPAIDLPSGLYWSIFGLFDEILKGLKNAVDCYGEKIASIAIDTWACDFGLFDKDGEIIGMPHQYRDSRTDGMADQMHQLMSESDIFKQTGIKTNFYNSSLHLMALNASESPSLKHAESLLFIPDILAYWLTGVKSVEKTNASTSQLLDPETGNWSDEVINALKLPRHIFGEIVAPGDILGELRPEIGAIIGRSDIPVVVAPCHDTASAVAGIPLSESEPLWLSSGTWSIMGVESPIPIRSDEALEFGFCNELGINHTVRFLKNIGGLWIVQECKRQWEREGIHHSFSELAKLSENSEPFFAFIDPDAAVFATPGDMPSRIRDFCKQSGQQTPESIGQILRVATDSLALKYRMVYDRIVSLTGRKYNRLHAGGGGIQNQELCQATANALSIEVQAGPVEATSCGNLITQMIATGEVKDFVEGRNLIRHSFEFKTYQPKDTESWNQAFEKFTTFVS